jgi:uncharacterized damage-inducible protein DinB
MPISDSVLYEFDHEMANTRKMLERVPEDRLDFKPHPKSWHLGGLATHLSNVPSWTVFTMRQDSLDYAPPGAPPYKTPEVTSKADLLATFDKNTSDARAAISESSDEQFKQPWTLLAGGQPIFTMPRLDVLRSMIMNHSIHHRGQLSLYLRLLDVPVPGMYGPSADEA